MKHLLRDLRLAVASVSGVSAGTIPGVITLAWAEARPHIRQNWPRLRLAKETLRFISRRVLRTTTMEHRGGQDASKDNPMPWCELASISP